jgi:hypothetical protein
MKKTKKDASAKKPANARPRTRSKRAGLSDEDLKGASGGALDAAVVVSGSPQGKFKGQNPIKTR